MSDALILMRAVKAAQEIVARVLKSRKRKRTRGDKGLSEPGTDESGSVGIKNYLEPDCPQRKNSSGVGQLMTIGQK